MADIATCAHVLRGERVCLKQVLTGWLAKSCSTLSGEGTAVRAAPQTKREAGCPTSLPKQYSGWTEITGPNPDRR